MSSDVEKVIKNIISSTFDVSPEIIGRDTVAADVDGWDSLGHVTLLMLIERQLGVSLGQDDAGDLTDVGALIDSVKARNPTLT